MNSKIVVRSGITLLVVVVLVGFGFADSAVQTGSDVDSNPVLSQNETAEPTAAEILSSVPGEGRIHMTMATSVGTIHCEMYDDLVPNTVSNFVGLANGIKPFVDPATGETTQRRFYDGLVFHRVIPQFMIQGGDPLGNGTGGPGYRFNDEFASSLRHDRPGTLSMANSGPNTNGSQFFITEGPTPHLDNRHSVFGHCSDVDVISQIARVPSGPRDQPLQPVTIDTISFERR
jgi:peptidyl-prolyl cis-trans isomerase A (cyclophilin A)